MKEKIEIYIAAALFNGRETYFNSKLVKELEKIGYKTNFPQRDGFEFGNLTKAFKGKLPEEKIGSAVQSIIYSLDMGIFLVKSDVILTNLDESLDPGVIVEISHAKPMGKFVVGFRTDVRSPYGEISDKFRGMHFFPAYQCNKFIPHDISSKTFKKGNEEIKSLVNKIDETIKEAKIFHTKEIPNYAKRNPEFKIILDGANLLFHGIKNIHSKKGLEEIALRYLENEEKLSLITDKI